jgi:hypothetical protein
MDQSPTGMRRDRFPDRKRREQVEGSGPRRATTTIGTVTSRLGGPYVEQN